MKRDARKKLTRKASDFFSTAEGQAQTERSLAEARETGIALRRASVVDHDVLRKPFGPILRAQ